MVKIKDVRTPEGEIKTIDIPGQDIIVEAQGRLTILPALIDPHVHFRTPGAEYKEDWRHGAEAAIAGGVTTVIDMPNNIPSCCTKAAVENKMQLIDRQLEEVGIPLRYHLYLGADKNHIEEIGKAKKLIVGVKIYMGSSTGDLVMDDDEALDKVFQIAAQENVIIGIHAEDEAILKTYKNKYKNNTDPSIHSKIRDRSAAIKAVEKAIALTEKYSAQLCVLHLSTKEELELVKEAKQRELLVFAEVSPNHLFLNEKDYQRWGTRVQLNPPLRTEEDNEALWKGIRDGTVDMIGTDHAPHTLEEKNRPYGQAPSGIPGIETMLPLLLNAYHEERLSLGKIVELTRSNTEMIFQLPPQDDVVLVDLEMVKEVRNENLKTKCGWSPYVGKVLKGWPIYTILKGQVFRVG